jgi:hypothetical protein
MFPVAVTAERHRHQSLFTRLPQAEEAQDGDDDDHETDDIDDVVHR